MCFVSLAHPSAPLVAAALAAGEAAGASGSRAARRLRRRLRNGRAARPRDEPAPLSARLALHVDARHDRRRGGRVAHAAASTPAPPDHALAIAASEASGLKENFGTMVKPLHAGLAARNGVARGAAGAGRDDGEPSGDRRTAGISRRDGQRAAVARAVRRAISATRWEIVDTGITVKLYPSCAGTHPTLDALLDLEAARRLQRATRSRRSRSASTRSCRRSCSTTGRRADSKGSSACRSAPRRRSSTAASASTRSTPRVLGDPSASSRCRSRVDDARRSDARCVGAVAHAGARHGPAARRPRADRSRPTARAVIRNVRPATRSWRRNSRRARRRRSDARAPEPALECCRHAALANLPMPPDRGLRIGLKILLTPDRRPARRLATGRCTAPGSLSVGSRHVAALPDHERPRELDDRRLVLVHAGRLDPDDADVRAVTSTRASRAPRCASRRCRLRTAGSAAAPRPIPGWRRRSSSGR